MFIPWGQGGGMAGSSRATTSAGSRMPTLAKPRVLLQGDHSAAFHGFRSTSLPQRRQCGRSHHAGREKRVAVLESDIRLCVGRGTSEWGEKHPISGHCKGEILPEGPSLSILTFTAHPSHVVKAHPHFQKLPPHKNLPNILLPPAFHCIQVIGLDLFT